MIEKIAKIQNKLGLHARAASQFVKIAQEYASQITVSSQSATANGKSIMNMMLLQATCGTEITLKVEGEDEQIAVESLLKLIDQKFGEE